MKEILQHITDFIINHDLMVKEAKYLYMLPLAITILSLFIHVNKAYFNNRYGFTRAYCRIIGIGITLEIWANTCYITSVWNEQKLIEPINLIWVAILTLGTMIQLVSPLFIKAAEKFYINKLNEQRVDRQH